MSFQAAVNNFHAGLDPYTWEAREFSLDVYGCDCGDTIEDVEKLTQLRDDIQGILDRIRER